MNKVQEVKIGSIVTVDDSDSFMGAGDTYVVIGIYNLEEDQCTVYLITPTQPARHAGSVHADAVREGDITVV